VKQQPLGVIFIIAAVVCAGCGANRPAPRASEPAPDPGTLLALNPALPPTIGAEGQDVHIDWRRRPHDGHFSLPSCPDGHGDHREWSDRGREWALPRVFQVVCVFEEPDEARRVYSSMSLAKVAGEDWPNYEPEAAAPAVPSDLRSLDALAANEWEIGCGVGDPNVGCSVWTFRARYGRVLTDVEYAASPGRISLRTMSALLRSIDAELTARVG
jgi:hypothetical protein